MGSEIDGVERRANGATIIREWRPNELSLTFLGRQPDAAVDPSWDLNTLYEQVQEQRAEARRRAAVLRERSTAEVEQGRLAYLLQIAAGIAPDLGIPTANLEQAMRNYHKATAPDGFPGASLAVRH